MTKRPKTVSFMNEEAPAVVFVEAVEEAEEGEEAVVRITIGSHQQEIAAAAAAATAPPTTTVAAAVERPTKAITRTSKLPEGLLSRLQKRRRRLTRSQRKWPTNLRLSTWMILTRTK
jgi:hypothetical protein